MNILVETYGKEYIVRPDTTWERDNEDFFVPEFIDALSYTPVLFARICKPGRSVGRNFASRYYDGVGYGILLYPENMISGEAGIAKASCIDHTSFLPFPVYNKLTLGQEDNCFCILKDGGSIFETNCGNAGMIEDAIAAATRFIYIRTGDLIAIELGARKPLCSRSEGETSIRATFCDNETIGFKILF